MNGVFGMGEGNEDSDDESVHESVEESLNVISLDEMSCDEGQGLDESIGDD